MRACLSFNEIVEVGQPQIVEMDRLGSFYPSADVPGVCAAFTRQVRLVEGVVVQTYGVAAAMARKAGELSEVAEIWKEVSRFCQSSLEVLAHLKHKYPHCGTPELYDLVLDYKLAADKRFKGVMEEQACQKTDLPQGLFPEMS